jgi:hypothetical protein
MMALFIIVSVAIMIVTAHTPEEWQQIINDIKE